MSIVAIIVVPLLFLGFLALIQTGRTVSRVAIARPQQRKSDQLAEEVLQELRAGGRTPTFCLYLRSFGTDDLSVNWPRVLNGYYGESSITPTKTLDEEISSLLSKRYGQVLCLGTEQFTIGAGRISSTDERWREDVDLLALHAKLVVIMPWDTEGVLEECARINGSASLRTKAIFFMPPFIGGASIEWHWNRAVEASKRLGFKLPSYDEQGAFFHSSGLSHSALTVLCGSRGEKALLSLLSEEHYWQHTRGDA